MAVRVTSNPSGELPGSVIGRPMRLPAILMCTQGERFCGAKWTANTEHELVLALSARRDHETACRGALIVAGGA